jgi:hypothetical protein
MEARGGVCRSLCDPLDWIVGAAGSSARATGAGPVYRLRVWPVPAEHGAGDRLRLEGAVLRWEMSETWRKLIR